MVAFSKLRSTSFNLLLLILRKDIWEHDFITAIAFIHVPLTLGIPVQIHKLSGVLVWSLRSVTIGILVVQPFFGTIDNVPFTLVQLHNGKIGW